MTQDPIQSYKGFCPQTALTKANTILLYKSSIVPIITKPRGWGVIRQSTSESKSVWPDWEIYWTLGNFIKHLATINLPKSPTFLGNLCKSLIFQVKSFWANFTEIWQFFSGHTDQVPKMLHHSFAVSASIKMRVTIAQWICLRLPSCGPGFEFRAQQLRFMRFI